MSADMVNRIRTLAEEQGINLAGLEYIVKIKKGSIEQWETHPPRLDKLQKVAKRLKVSLNYLVTGSDIPLYREYCVTTGQRIKFRRQELGMTVEELSDISDCPIETILGLENDEFAVFAPIIKSLSIALEVSADWLLGLTDRYGGEGLPGDEQELLMAYHLLSLEQRRDVIDYIRFKTLRRLDRPKSGSGVSR